MLDAAEPGSDRQLALARLHIESATDPAHLARLGDLLAGRAELPGLLLEDDLRWAAVIRCAAMGAAGGELIDAELAADPTTRGAQFAAQARAAMPTASAKSAAWEAAVAGGLSNMALAATLAGFAHPDTPAGLLDPYRQPYVEAVRDLFTSRSPGEALALARGLFPPDRSDDRGGSRRAARRRPPRGPAAGGARAPGRRPARAGLPGGVARGRVSREWIGRVRCSVDR